MAERPVRLRVFGFTAAVVFWLGACDSPTHASRTRPTTTTTSVTTPFTIASPAAAEQALATIPIKGRAPKTGYTRSQFGPRWADVDHNGCDTRNDVLRRDLTDVAFRPGTRECVVVSGTLLDPYTGQTVTFDKTKAYEVQIDHVVALGDAWQKGAQQLSADERQQFANDPLNLLAVSGSANESKGDGDAATWMPPNKPARCAYVARQIAVKQKWHLWMTAAEADASHRVLARCPNEPLPGYSQAIPSPSRSRADR